MLAVTLESAFKTVAAAVVDDALVARRSAAAAPSAGLPLCRAQSARGVRLLPDSAHSSFRASFTI